MLGDAVIIQPLDAFRRASWAKELNGQLVRLIGSAQDENGTSRRMAFESEHV